MDWRAIPGIRRGATLFTCGDGFYYRYTKVGVSKTDYTCYRPDCCAQVWMDSGQTCIMLNINFPYHNHGPEPLLEAVWDLRNKILSRVQKESLPIRAIFDDECNKVDKQIASQLDFSAMSSALSKSRKSASIATEVSAATTVSLIESQPCTSKSTIQFEPAELFIEQDIDFGKLETSKMLTFKESKDKELEKNKQTVLAVGDNLLDDPTQQALDSEDCYDDIICDSVDNNSDDDTQPTVPQPSVSKPSVPNPSVSNPSVSNPSVSKPSVSKPSVPNPSVSYPSVSNPSVSKPSVLKPTVSNPSVPKPTNASEIVFKKHVDDSNKLDNQRKYQKMPDPRQNTTSKRPTTVSTKRTHTSADTSPFRDTRLDWAVQRLESISDKIVKATLLDSFDEFGKHLSSLLRGLPEHKVYFLKKKLINEVFEALCEDKFKKVKCVGTQTNKESQTSAEKVPKHIQTQTQATQIISSGTLEGGVINISSNSSTPKSGIETTPRTVLGGGVLNVSSNSSTLKPGIAVITPSTISSGGGVINVSSNSSTPKPGIEIITPSTVASGSGVINISSNSSTLKPGIEIISPRTVSSGGGVINVSPNSSTLKPGIEIITPRTVSQQPKRVRQRKQTLMMRSIHEPIQKPQVDKKSIGTSTSCLPNFIQANVRCSATTIMPSISTTNSSIETQTIGTSTSLEQQPIMIKESQVVKKCACPDRSSSPTYGSPLLTGPLSMIFPTASTSSSPFKLVPMMPMAHPTETDITTRVMSDQPAIMGAIPPVQHSMLGSLLTDCNVRTVNSSADGTLFAVTIPKPQMATYRTLRPVSPISKKRKEATPLGYITNIPETEKDPLAPSPKKKGKKSKNSRDVSSQGQNEGKEFEMDIEDGTDLKQIKEDHELYEAIATDFEIKEEIPDLEEITEKDFAGPSHPHPTTSTTVQSQSLSAAESGSTSSTKDSSTT
ncbi:uncharacterized protein LOC128993572 isoform X3 [Macrosteles quadrilineatus]|uniref:uncharacterized protein LOC128993572 isoform X3 n=1 Tax=Macrosteles quadrilineatus TaxID=74068 RepID=UPI0023E0E583|nr:uncharacterized protein LOC128993572 isoform X3 [Macrosteles quadrilineatus]